jgi:hypothetical protein
MKLIAFVEGRPKPQPRTTQKVKFLFSKSVEDWVKTDAENSRKALLGMINKKGNPFKATRYAYRLERFQLIAQYRERVYQAVYKATNGKIPTQNLFIFYLFHSPKTWSKKKAKAHEWQFHILKPDYKNLLTAVEDCLYEKDSECNAVSHYKLYVPKDYKEGLLLLHDEEIHRYIIDIAIESFIKPSAIGAEFEL